MDFDDILPEIGEYGTYQKLILWFLLMPGTFPCGFHAYNQLFMAQEPTHWCLLTEDWAKDAREVNVSEEVIRKIGIPFEEETQIYSKCTKYVITQTELISELNIDDVNSTVPNDHILRRIHNNSDVIPCDAGWHFKMEDYTTSVVSDFNLVCDRSFGPTMALVLLGTSGFVGSLIFGYLMDGLGRRPAFFLYLSILCFFGMSTPMMPSFLWWLLCRIGVGFTIPAIMSTPFVLAIELVGPKQRTYTTVMMNVAYSISLILLSVIIYFVRIWSQLSFATTIPFLAFIAYWWVLPESPRWLLAKGRTEEACRVIRTMAKVNKKSISEETLSQIKRYHCKTKNISDKKQKIETTQKSFGILDLFKTPNMCKKTLIITFIWFSNTSVYVGLSYYAPSLGGDAYLNFFLAAVSELPTYIFLWPAMEFLGRRCTLCFSMGVGGIACIATVLVRGNVSVTLILYCIGKFGISSSFVVLPLMASELYPTVVRGIGLGLSSTAGMVGPIVIPFINHLGTHMMTLPLLIMGVLLVLGGLLTLLLPETLHQRLPETLKEGEEFGKDMTWRHCFSFYSSREKLCNHSEIQLLQNKIDSTTETKIPIDSEIPVEMESKSKLRRISFMEAQNEEISILCSNTRNISTKSLPKLGKKSKLNQKNSDKSTQKCKKSTLKSGKSKQKIEFGNEAEKESLCPPSFKSTIV